jgi:hypothetical protein
LHHQCTRNPSDDFRLWQGWTAVVPAAAQRILSRFDAESLHDEVRVPRDAR